MTPELWWMTEVDLQKKGHFKHKLILNYDLDNLNAFFYGKLMHIVAKQDIVRFLWQINTVSPTKYVVLSKSQDCAVMNTDNANFSLILILWMRHVVVIQYSHHLDLCYSVEHCLVHHASNNILKNQTQYENEKKLLKVK